MGSQIAVIKATLKYTTQEALIKGMAPLITRRGLFIHTRTTRPVGSEVHFEFQLADGSQTYSGEGIVRKEIPFVGGPSSQKSGMLIALKRINRPFKQVVDAILNPEEAQPEPVEEVTAPAPEAAPKQMIVESRAGESDGLDLFGGFDFDSGLDSLFAGIEKKVSEKTSDLIEKPTVVSGLFESPSVSSELELDYNAEYDADDGYEFDDMPTTEMGYSLDDATPVPSESNEESTRTTGEYAPAEVEAAQEAMMAAEEADANAAINEVIPEQPEAAQEAETAQEAVQESAEVAQDAEAVQESAEVAQEAEAIQESAEIAQEAEAVQESAEIAQEAEAVQESAEAVQESAEAIQDAAEVAQDIEAIQDPEAAQVQDQSASIGGFLAQNNIDAYMAQNVQSFSFENSLNSFAPNNIETYIPKSAPLEIGEVHLDIGEKAPGLNDAEKAMAEMEQLMPHQSSVTSVVEEVISDKPSVGSLGSLNALSQEVQPPKEESGRHSVEACFTEAPSQELKNLLSDVTADDASSIDKLSPEEIGNAPTQINDVIELDDEPRSETAQYTFGRDDSGMQPQASAPVAPTAPSNELPPFKSAALESSVAVPPRRPPKREGLPQPTPRKREDISLEAVLKQTEMSANDIVNRSVSTAKPAPRRRANPEPEPEIPSAKKGFFSNLFKK